MNERLRTLSPLLRLIIYIAGVILLFIIAVGIGATTALLIGRQVGAGPTGFVGNGNLEGGKTQTTGIRASESTAIEPSSEPTNPSDTVEKASFTQRAKKENSRGDYTYIGDPSINDDADAIVLVSLTSDRSSDTTPYGHDIGVWFEPVARKWAVFNQDRAPVPEGTTFRVVVPPASTKFVHRADLLDTAGNYTYLDNPLTNGQPNAELTVTQNWNPGGGSGVYNDHPVGTKYDAKLEKWAVYNRDGAPMPKGASFNIAVSPGPDQSRK